MDNRQALENAAHEALKAAQQPAGDLRDLNDEQVRFIASYWAHRPRVSNDDRLNAMKQR